MENTTKATTNSMERAKEIMKDISNNMSRRRYLDMIKANRDIAVQQIDIFGNKETTQKILDKAKELGKEKLNELSDEEIHEIFKECEATDLLSSIAANQVDKGFLRDYITYIEDTDKQLKELDELVEECEKEIEESNNKVAELVNEVGDVSKFIIKTFEEQAEHSEGKVKENYENAVKVVNDALTLRPVIELFKTIGTKGTLREFNIQSERQRIIEKFYKAVKSYKVSTDLRPFTDFEVKFMDEKYHQYEGLFIFAIMKYFSNRGYGKRTNDGLFITQLSIVLQTVFNGNKSEEDLKEFVGYATELLDLFI